MKTIRFGLTFFFGIGLAALAMVAARGQTALAAPDAPPFDILYVATTGSDSTHCTNSATPCATIQYAVDRAGEGDEIRVAGGEYTDVHTRPRNDFNTTGFVDQIVYLTKTVTIRGGYSTTNWTLSDPDANPTTLDAQYQGRGVYITGPISPTLEGLRIVQGSADGQGGGQGGNDGGGIFVYDSALSLLNSQVLSNTNTSFGSDGSAVSLYEGTANFTRNIFKGNQGTSIASSGTLYFMYSEVVLNENEILSNTAGGSGGGAWLVFSTGEVYSNTFLYNHAALYEAGGVGFDSSSGEIEDNVFIGNTSVRDGGGVWVSDLYPGRKATIKNNYFENNKSNEDGGAIYVQYIDAVTITHNIMLSNTATYGGGGMRFIDTSAYMENNWIAHNHGGWAGGGMYIDAGTSLLSKNDVIVDNSIDEDGYGSGIFMNGDFPIRMFHPTIADNHGGNETGIFFLSELFTMTNGILSGHQTGIHVEPYGTVHMEGTLWNNTTNITGTGPITTGTINLYGDPGFLDPTNGNYHLSPNSPAIDAGIDAGVTTDIDGDTRPQGAGFDIGADENALLIRYVATTGSDTTDCTNSATPCATIQYAVDQAGEGNEIRVAGGEYTDVHTRPRNDFSTTGFVDQIVYLTKTMTIRGGYSTANWTLSDPDANPTTLDAQYQGRGVYITGPISPTLEGLRIVQGSADGQKGRNNTDVGGGIYGYYATIYLLDSQLISNTNTTPVSSGGAVFVYEGVANFAGNIFQWNNTSTSGGTLDFMFSYVTLIQNQIISNTAVYAAGASFEFSPSQIFSNTFIGNNSLDHPDTILRISDSSAQIQNNSFIRNDANGIEISGGVGNSNSVAVHYNYFLENVSENYGGAISALYTDVTITHNTILSNTANAAGGIHLLDTNAYMENNWIAHNHGGWAGGAMYINSDTALLSKNDMLVDNYVDVNGYGSGIFMNTMEELSVYMFHPTISDNYGGNETGIFFLSGSVSITNAILSGHQVGIQVEPDWGIIHFEATLWDNDINIAGEGTITTGTINLYGNPSFLDPTHGDYHISPASIARDTGIDAGVTTDIDGDPRPQGPGFDIGADESRAFYLPSGIVQLQGRTNHSGAIITAWSGGTAIMSDTTNSAGAYALTIPDGVYTLTIEMPLYLDAVKTNVFIANTSPIPLTPVILKGGDANDSDKVNILDLSLIGAHYTLACGDPNWDFRADINNDCVVNLLDLVLAAGNFGRTSPVYWPD